ncbi:MAG TPA: sulfotransferase [Polyangia bacterium]|nr:sulfotransferase [Polyangia bacterium]
MRKAGPDFFVVGAPKCGTTAMNEYLGQHPELGMCPRKETQYFATDLRARFAVKRGQRPLSLDQYLGLFEQYADLPRRGEASVWYLYSSEAAREIRKFSSRSEAIVMLRNPVEMLPSLHSQFVYVGLEPVEDFEQALALDPERERDGTPRGFPPRSYRSAIRYAEQLTRYLDVLGRDRVHVVVYEDFRDNTVGAYRDTCEFLGVDPEFVPTIEVVNANKRVRSRAMRRIARRPPEAMRTVLHRVSSQEMRRRAAATMRRINTRAEQRPPVRSHVSELLRPEVERQVRELDELIGLDVSAWLE